MALDKVLSCIWGLSINGAELDMQRRRCINSISISENCDGSDVATISITDKDGLFIEDNIFVEDSTVSITLMFVSTTDKITFSGYISAIDISFPDTGMPTLKLTCLDQSHVMNRVEKSRSWSKMTNPQVAQKIAAEYGFKFEGPTAYAGEVQDTISQSNQTDIDFLENLASQEKGKDLYMCKLVNNTLIYKKKGLLASPVMTVHYKKYPYEVVSFTPRINKETMQSTTTTSDVSTDTKKTDKATSSGTSNTQGSKVSSSGSSSGSSQSSAKMTYNAKTQSWSKKG